MTNEHLKEWVPRRIDARLKALGMTRSELGRRTGASKQMITAMTKGNVLPSVQGLYALATELRCSADYLLGLTDDPTPVVEKKPIDRTHVERALVRMSDAAEDLRRALASELDEDNDEDDAPSRSPSSPSTSYASEARLHPRVRRNQEKETNGNH